MQFLFIGRNRAGQHVGFAQGVVAPGAGFGAGVHAGGAASFGEGAGIVGGPGIGAGIGQVAGGRAGFG